MVAARVSLAQRRQLTEQAERRQRFLRRATDTVTRKTGITSAGFILAGVSTFAWILAYWVGGRPLYTLSYACLVALVVSWLVGRRPPPLVGERGDHSPRVREGERVTFHVSLEAARRLSNLVLEERVPSLLGDHARKPIATIEPGSPIDHTYELTCWRRGAFTVGPLYASWGDPMGFTKREVKLADEFEVLVHPGVEPVEDHPLTRLWEDPPFRPPVSKPWPHGLEFYGMREYVPGDDPRRVVWRAYARTGQLLVRESEQGITDKLVIVLDQDENNHTRGIVSDSFEAACRSAASVGIHDLREGYSVTLEGTERKLVGPLRGGSPIALLDELSRVEPAKGSLSKTLERVLSTTPRDAHVVIVTPLLDSTAAARLQILVDRGQSVVVVALMWLDEAVDTLASAAGLGVRVVEIGPKTNMTGAFQHAVATAGVKI